MVKLGKWSSDPAKDERQKRLWREWGFKFQVAAQPLLEEMGYKIIGGQHIPFTGISSRRKLCMEKLGDYLWNYADYVAMKNDDLCIIDVKSQGYVPVPKGKPIDHSVPEEIHFTKREKSEYPRSKVQVLILLILYRWGGKWRKLTGTGRLGTIWLLNYANQPSVWRLGPLHYKLVPFTDFKFENERAGGILADKFGGCKKLSSLNVYFLLRKTRALDIVEVRPGYVKRGRGERIVATE